MRPFLRTAIAAAVLSFGFSMCLTAQDKEKEERKADQEFYESVNNEIDRLTNLLDLDDWQIFYVDSILVHDYKAMREELKDLQDKKVSNTDLYYNIQYKWQDSIYYAYEKIFNEEQWAKYLKNGAARDKKNRDKRMSKSK